MRKYLAACVAVALLTLPLPSLAAEECAEGLIHVMPFCFTPDDLVVFLLGQVQNGSPEAVYVAPVDLVRQLAYYYWPDWAAERMVRIAKCESGYSPTARHPRSGAAGLWQIMPGWQKTWPGDYFDPWTNAAVAYQIWRVQGYGAWVCRG